MLAINTFAARIATEGSSSKPAPASGSAPLPAVRQDRSAELVSEEATVQFSFDLDGPASNEGPGRISSEAFVERLQELAAQRQQSEATAESLAVFTDPETFESLDSAGEGRLSINDIAGYDQFDPRADRAQNLLARVGHEFIGSDRNEGIFSLEDLEFVTKELEAGRTVEDAEAALLDRLNQNAANRERAEAFADSVSIFADPDTFAALDSNGDGRLSVNDVTGFDQTNSDADRAKNLLAKVGDQITGTNRNESVFSQEDLEFVVNGLDSGLTVEEAEAALLQRLGGAEAGTGTTEVTPLDLGADRDSIRQQVESNNQLIERDAAENGLEVASPPASLVPDPLSFDEEFYLESNPDVAAAVANGSLPSGREHFELFGESEGRNPNSDFDEAFYLASNPDVAAAVEAGHISSGFEHYRQFGAEEQRLPSANHRLIEEPITLEDFINRNFESSSNSGSVEAVLAEYAERYGIEAGTVLVPGSVVTVTPIRNHITSAATGP